MQAHFEIFKPYKSEDLNNNRYTYCNTTIKATTTINIVHLMQPPATFEV